MRRSVALDATSPRGMLRLTCSPPSPRTRRGAAPCRGYSASAPGAHGREVGVYTVCHVVCRETQAEAEAYYDRYANQPSRSRKPSMRIWRARRSFRIRMGRKRTSAIAARDSLAEPAAIPWLERPERIVETNCRRSHEQGYAGAALDLCQPTPGRIAVLLRPRAAADEAVGIEVRHEGAPAWLIRSDPRFAKSWRAATWPRRHLVVAGQRRHRRNGRPQRRRASS